MASSYYRFKISKKRMIKETSKVYVFVDRQFKGNPFFIPKKEIIESDSDSIIRYNDTHGEPAYFFVIPTWLAAKNKIDEYRQTMGLDFKKL